MKRHAITDKMWALIAPMIAKQGGSNDNRLFIDAVMYVAKTGVPWRDLPATYGNWNSIFTRFNRWSRKGLWGLIFDATADEDPLAIAIDSTTVRANQVAAGLKKSTCRQAGLGRSRGGLTAKIHLAVNAVGKFCRLLGGAGQESDYTYAPKLLENYRPLFGMGDKGYDSDLIVGLMEQGGNGEAVIPPRSNRKVERAYDKDKYKGRNVVERAINRLKCYRRVATRYDKLLDNFLSFVCLAAAALNLK